MMGILWDKLGRLDKYEHHNNICKKSIPKSMQKAQYINQSVCDIFTWLIAM